MYLVCKDSWFVRTSSMRGPLVWQNSWFVRTNGMWGNYVRSKLQSGMKRSTTSGMQGQLVSEDNWYVRTEDFCGQLVYMWGQQVYVRTAGFRGQSSDMWRQLVCEDNHGICKVCTVHAYNSSRCFISDYGVMFQHTLNNLIKLVYILCVSTT